MSTNNSRYPSNVEVIDRDDSRASDLALMDFDELKQKRRLSRILDAHDNVEDTANFALECYTGADPNLPRIDQNGMNTLLLRAVQQFIGECYNALLDHAAEVVENTDEGKEPQDRYWFGYKEAPVGVLQFEDFDRAVVFQGLRDVLHAERIYRETKTVKRTPRNRPQKTEEKEEIHTVPEQVSWAAYFRLKEFLKQERELDLSFTAGEYRSPEPGL